MSDSPNPLESAIDLLREREQKLSGEIEALIARREEVRDTIGMLSSRKPRAPRKPRVAEPNGPGALNLEAAVEDAG
jgi:hypothetical protein